MTRRKKMLRQRAEECAEGIANAVDLHRAFGPVTRDVHHQLMVAQISIALDRALAADRRKRGAR